MKFLGLDIRREQPVIRAGSNFAARTILNQAVEARAAARGVPQSSMTAMIEVPNNNYGTISWQQGHPVAGDLEDRAIRSDPRELWFLSLPNKITPQQCLNILRAALGGDIWQQWQLLSLMLDTWPTFRMAAHQLRESVAYTKFNVMPWAEEGEEPSPEAKERAGLVSRAMKSMNPNPFTDEKGFSGMVYDMTDAMLNGMCLVELLWERRRVATKNGGTQEMMPRASAWVHPRHFTFTNTGEIAVFDDDYGRLYDDPRVNRTPISQGSPDPDKFMAAQFISRSGSSLGAGFMRPLVWYWAARQFNNEWMLNTAKQYGAPFIDITYRPGQTEQDERNKLAQFLKNAGAERRLIHPEGTVAQIHPAQSLGGDNPQRYLTEEADKMCLFLLLGQESSTKSVPGQLGGQDVKMDVKEERVSALASWVARNPLRQFARAILRQNYGDDEMCPEIVPDRTRPLGSAEVSTLVSSINASGMPVRADELYKKIGFSQPEPGDLIVQRGEVVEMLSEEEKYEQAMQQQQDQMEMQQAAQPAQVEASGKVQPFDTAAVLHRCTPEQLREIEDLVTAAEKAPHLNGEADMLQRHLRKIYDGQEAVKAKGKNENRC